MTMNERREILPLTGIRAIAAWLVVALHQSEQFPAWIAQPLYRTLHFGSNGVDLFFILSGIIITFTYGEQFIKFSWPLYRNFLIKRIARLYPASLVALIVLLLIGVVLFASGRDPDFFIKNSLGQLFAHLTLTFNWTIQAAPVDWNVPAWSISMEWLAYLLFPFIWRKILTLNQRGLVLTIIGLMLSMCVLISVTHLNDGMIRVLSEFTVGMCLYRLFKSGTFFSAPLGLIGIFCLLMFIALGVWLGWESGYVRLAVPLLVPVLYSLLCQRGVLASFCALPSVVYWGRVSYSLYITHYVVLAVTRFAFNQAGSDSLRLVIAAMLQLLLVIAVTLATYHWIEEPGRQWLSTLLKRLTVVTIPKLFRSRF